MNNNYGESEYEAEEILNQFSAQRVPYHASTPENRQKQKDIVEKLSPVFPKEKLRFWLDVATSNCQLIFSFH